MKLTILPMGCLSSRSTIAPSESDEEIGQKQSKISGTDAASAATAIGRKPPNDSNGSAAGRGKTRVTNETIANGHPSPDERNKDFNADNSTGADRLKDETNIPNGRIEADGSIENSSLEPSNDDIMSILMNDQEKSSKEEMRGRYENANGHRDGNTVDNGNKHNRKEEAQTNERSNQNSIRAAGEASEPIESKLSSSGPSVEREEEQSDGDLDGKKLQAEGSFDDESNLDLLRQYVAIDYEITQLEDKDALRVYHEKIEQLEQLERELDMISLEAEEVAGRSKADSQSGVLQSPSATTNGAVNNSKMDPESNSILSGATGSMSHKSWINTNIDHKNQTGKGDHSIISNQNQSQQQQKSGSKSGSRTPTRSNRKIGDTANSQLTGVSSRRFNNLSTYSTVEEVFNRKIILEKERDKLKKEVEMVIVECDKLQQRYKKRDEILDKLFDGRTGNGLENHLEQQLNWLLEQKHYVDQVFYAWKRAETLTSQTCEQFASALELLKRLPKVQDPEQRAELAKSIGSLLVKSRQDMEQAQKYNPNVDAPFFTDNETERFDRIIETISSESINPNEYSQILTVIQFAYKRSVSIRVWLEQILQTTIARDSFELAEEYKWIAIQLRKERINLIKSRLQDSPYQSMARSIREQLAQQQSLVEHRQKQLEINRDSGVESETNDIDIEEEIYRLLELNKWRLEMANNTNANSANPGVGAGIVSATLPSKQFSGTGYGLATTGEQQQLRVSNNQQGTALNGSSSSSDASNRDQMMRDRIQKRAQNGGPMLPLQRPGVSGLLEVSESNLERAAKEQSTKTPTTLSGTPFAGTASTAKAITSAHMSEVSNSNSLAASSLTPTKLRVELDEEARQSLLKQVDQIHLRHKSRMERLRDNNKAIATNSIMDRMQQVRRAQRSSTGNEELNGKKAPLSQTTTTAQASTG